MASLLSSMTGAEIVNLLEVLSEHGVTAEDLEFIRKHRRGVAKHLAELIKIPRRLFNEAVAGSREAVIALSEWGDVEVMTRIYAESKEPSVWIAVMEILTNDDTIYHLIRVYSNPGREEASLVGARKLSTFYLRRLQYDDGYQERSSLIFRRLIVAKVRAENDAIERTESDRHRGDRE